MPTRYYLCLMFQCVINQGQVIKLAPSSYQGYELRNAALCGMSRHAEADEAFDVMLSKLEGSEAPPHHSQCKRQNDILGRQ